MNLAKYCQKDLDKYYFYINRVSVESENAKNKEQQHVLNVFSYFDVYFKSTHLTIRSNTCCWYQLQKHNQVCLNLL